MFIGAPSAVVVLPTLTLGSTTNYNQNSAVFNATVNTGNRNITLVEFQHSTSSSFASGNSAWFTASTNSTIAQGQTSAACTYNATGLTASVAGTPSTYYVRFRVTNSSGFTTTSSIGGSFNTYRARVDVFTSSGTWTNPVPTSGTGGLAIETLTQLVLCGGGGPGLSHGGAGGTLTGFSNVYIPGLTTLAVTIGAGGGVYTASGSPTSIGSYSASGGQTGGSFGSSYRGGDGNGYIGGSTNPSLGASSPSGGGAGAGGNGGNAQGYVGGTGGPAVYGLAGGGGGGTSLFADPVTYLGSPSGEGPANTGQGGGGYNRATNQLSPGGSGYADIKYWGPY